MPAVNVSLTSPGSDMDSINRRMKLAEQLQAQSLQPIQSSRPDAPISWTQGLAQMLQAYAGKKQMERAEGERKSLVAETENRRGADLSLLVKALGGRQAQPQGLSEDASGNVTQRDAIPAQSPMQSLQQALPMMRDPQMQQAALGAYLPLAQQDVRRQQLMAGVQQQPIPQGNPMVPGQPGSSVMAGSGSNVPQQQPQQGAIQFGVPVGGMSMQQWLEIDPTGGKYMQALAKTSESHGAVHYDQQGRAYVVTKGGQAQYLPGITARDKGQVVNRGGFQQLVNEFTGAPIGGQMQNTLTPEQQYSVPLAQQRQWWETGQAAPTPLQQQGGPQGSPIPQAGHQAAPAPQPRPQPAPQAVPPQAAPRAGNLTPKERAEIEAARPVQTKAVQGVMLALHDSLSAADNVINAEGIGRITGPVAGRTPNMTGTATNAQADLDTLKSQIGVRVLTAMREASKTGGAVGNVTEKEWPILQNQLGSLQQSQTTAQFKSRLKEVKATLQRMQDNARQAYEADYGKLDWMPPAKGQADEKPPNSVINWSDLGR